MILLITFCKLSKQHKFTEKGKRLWRDFIGSESNIVCTIVSKRLAPSEVDCQIICIVALALIRARLYPFWFTKLEVKQNETNKSHHWKLGGYPRPRLRRWNESRTEGSKCRRRWRDYTKTSARIIEPNQRASRDVLRSSHLRACKGLDPLAWIGLEGL